MNSRITIALVALMMMNACSSLSEKSTSIFADKQPGVSSLDTITKEDKEESAWFKSYYGTNHCGVWAGTCPPE